MLGQFPPPNQVQISESTFERSGTRPLEAPMPVINALILLHTMSYGNLERLRDGALGQATGVEARHGAKETCAILVSARLK